MQEEHQTAKPLIVSFTPNYSGENVSKILLFEPNRHLKIKKTQEISKIARIQSNKLSKMLFLRKVNIANLIKFNSRGD